MKNIAYENISNPSKTSVIIARGQSVNKSKNKIIDFCSRNNPVIICPNVGMEGINTDYLVFADPEIFLKLKDTITPAQTIILGSKIYDYENLPNKKFLLDHYTGRRKIIEKISIKDKYIDHRIFNTGFACIFIAYFLKMEKIYLFGFDGREQDKSIKHYDGTKGKIGKGDGEKEKDFLELIIKFISKKNIEIFVDKNCPFRGIYKTKLKIKDF